jgi:hypothetical protein
MVANRAGKKSFPRAPGLYPGLPPFAAMLDQRRMMPSWEEIRRKRGQSCVGSIFAAGAVVLLAWIGWNYYLYKAFEVYASESAAKIPVFDGGDSMYKESLLKVAAFQKQLKAHAPGSLILSADEINTIIARLPNLGRFRGQIYVSMQGSQGLVQFSVPYQQLVKFFATKRYVNGGAYFTLAFDPTTYQLVTTFQGFKVNDTDLSPALRDELAAHFNSSLQQSLGTLLSTTPSPEQIQTVTIRTGELVVKTQ